MRDIDAQLAGSFGNPRYWRSAGWISARHHFEETALHVLFVCTGNICRSPTAERLAAARAARLSIPDFRTSSAGTRAVVGRGIHEYAIPVLERLGGEASGFAARQLTSRIASRADLIIAMTRSHRDAVLEVAPNKLHRTFTLSEVSSLVLACDAQTVTDLAVLRPQLDAHQMLDVPDPIGQTADVFEQVGSLIDHLLEPVVELCRRSVVRTVD